MDIKDMKEEIAKIDNEMIELINTRIGKCTEIAQYRQKNGLPSYDGGYTQEKLKDIMEHTDDSIRSYVYMMYSFLSDVSRSYENGLMHPSSDLMDKISRAIEDTDKVFPSYGVVACQGVAGAFSQHACNRIFEMPNIMYFNHFEGVFTAIDKGLCQYGVLPVENSTAGSVNAIYDLMMKYHFCIVRSIRLKVDHSLLVLPETRLEDIREIYTHEQAIGQCSDYLKKLENIKITACENTASAAKMVAESGRKDVAAIASRDCADLYGLQSVGDSIQNTDNNYTRFICIAKSLEIYAGANRTSIMMTIGNKPGTLYKVLARFYALGINLVKLESRPLPDRDFEFMFYFDLETSVYSPRFTQLICELDEMSEKFSYLGSYMEII